MFRNVKESFFNMVTSRIFVLLLFFLVIFGVLINRIFTLQIVRGEEYLNSFKLKIRKERYISGTRGNIYDRNGNLLAYNELAYSVTIEDVYEGSNKNADLNQTIHSLIDMVEDNGDHIITDFNIILNKEGQYEFAVQGTQLQRFLADIYGKRTYDELKYAQMTATADEVMNYLGGSSKFAVGELADSDNRESFEVGKGYSKEEVLEIVTIRYAMSLNSFQKYIPTTVASAVSPETVALVMENSDLLDGVSITEGTVRKYEDSTYFSHVLGYTGKISPEELETLGAQDSTYSMNDIIGKAGIEQYMELDLKGSKSKEVFYVDNVGKIIETTDYVTPAAGQDLYLTIDRDLQKAVYCLIEQEIAGILVAKIENIKEYIPAENATASNIKIPIDDVYYALINNSVIDIQHFSDPDAKETEAAVYADFLAKQDAVVSGLRQELTDIPSNYNALTTEYQVYELYIMSMLNENGVLISSKIDDEDEFVAGWKNETISLKEYLDNAIAKNWIDITKLELDSRFSDSGQVYDKLLDYIEEDLRTSIDFSKRMYRYLIKDNILSGRQICQLLFEQRIIEGTDEEKEGINTGTLLPFNFMVDKIKNLDITPAQLALDPCSGSCVVTNTKTGEVLALVTYPSYDNNRLANSIDAGYYAKLTTDLSRPLWDYATQQRSAPGSTFKMISTVAGLENNVVTTGETISCVGTWDTISPPARCWHISGHGPLNIEGAIEHSCNYYFYELGYRLSRENGVYNSDAGLAKLAEYADMFGLSESSGVEITEYEPQISGFDAIRSSIGQGEHNYTTVGLARYVTTVANSGTCFNLSIIDKTTDSSGNLIKDYTPAVRNQVELSPDIWNTIHSGMRKVVENKAYYQDMPTAVAGKTGTAQENRNRASHALFLGYAPYHNPEISIATRIAFGYSSDYAAEVSRDVIRYYFNPEDEEELITGTAVITTNQVSAEN